MLGLEWLKDGLFVAKFLHGSGEGLSCPPQCTTNSVEYLKYEELNSSRLLPGAIKLSGPFWVVSTSAPEGPEPCIQLSRESYKQLEQAIKDKKDSKVNFSMT